MTVERIWFFYVLLCVDGSFYAGISTDVARRLNQHSRGKGARYTRAHRPLQLLYRESCAGRAQALRQEAAFKALSRAQKQKWLQARQCDGLPS